MLGGEANLVMTNDVTLSFVKANGKRMVGGGGQIGGRLGGCDLRGWGSRFKKQQYSENLLTVAIPLNFYEFLGRIFDRHRQ